MKRMIQRHPFLFMALFVALVMLAGYAFAFAYEYPMVPIPSGQGPMLNGGLNGPMVPNAPGTPSPPPGCSNSLDFTDGCNSQYLSIMRF